jgi:ribosomal protein S12 methylthiotransferase accessory factor
MMSGTAPFRSVTAEVAVETAVLEAERLDARLDARPSGPSDHPIIRARLMRGDTVLASGCGKGPGAQGLASAYFEALERYLMSAPESRRRAAGAARLLSAGDVADQPGLRADLVVRRWAREFPGSRAACVPHQDTSNKPVWYPIFLSDPRYFRRPLPGDSVTPYRSLLRYCSSLGTAAGVDRGEAVFHGLCELIEHDGVSHALLRWFLARSVDVDLVSPDDLPAELGALHHLAQEATGRPVHLVDVTTDLAVPVYVAVAEPEPGQTAMTGAGAAPHAAYAAERAISELIQVSALDPPTVDVGKRLARWPALQDCARLPVRRLLAGRVTRVPLRDSLDDDPSPQAGLDRVVDRLAQRDIGYHVYDLAPPRSHIAVAATVAPGLERFSLVRLGMPVLPTGRGWALWPT